MDPNDHAELIEACRALVYRLPEGFMVVARREPGLKNGIVVLTDADGQSTHFIAKVKKIK
jgi:hypothetical protein